MKMAARFSQFILISALIFLAILIFPQKSLATLSACSATIDTHMMDINSNSDVILEVTNNDDNWGRMLWMSITSPTSNLTIEGHGSSESYSGFDSGVGSPLDERITVDAGPNAESSKDWIVQASDDPNGANPTNCSGDLGMQVIDPANYQPPQLSGVTVSNVTDTSVTLSFTTTRDATCELDYGVSGQAEDQVQNESSATSSHSFSLSGLTANTTYAFTIKAVNDNGETDGNGSFVTAATPYATAAPQVIQTTVTTTTVTVLTPTPTPTPIPDTTPPAVYLSTDFSKPFAQSPQINGTASDNKAVAKVEYSLDGGHNWLPVDSLPNAGKASTTYGFLPPPLDDGNYALQVRGTDTSNNIGYSKIYTLVIDRLPPQASGVLFSLGPQIINPREDGSIVALAGQPLKITLSEVGGSTQAAILATNLSGGSKQETSFNLTKNSDSGLWSGEMSLDADVYQLSFSGIDGAANRTTRDLNKVVVVTRGQTVSGISGNGISGKITVYYQEPVTNSWQVWDAGAYSQTNPQITDQNGNYNLFLPSGRYYLHIEAFGFKTTDTQFFTISQPEPINANFKLEPLKLLFSLGPIRLYLPDFSVLSLPFSNNLPQLSVSQNSLEGKPIPFFNLSVADQNQLDSDSLTGKPTVLTFLNTWSPASTEQMSILDKFAKNKDFNSAVIVEGEKVSEVYVFQKRGEYSLPVFADPDATLAVPYNLSFLPVHYFLDRKGIVQKVIYGALNEEELANTLINISQ